jgi:protein-S-isoprenylcysteine O-methyltransferase Ste14
MENKRPFRGILPPPIIFLTLLLVAFIAQRLFPFDLMFHSKVFRLIFAGTLLTVPGRLAARTFLAMRKGRTALDYSQPTTKLIVDGPFGFTRNPLYLSLLLVTGGIAIFANSMWYLVALLLLFLILNFWVVPREERYLENSFGEEYARYKKKVSRWIGSKNANPRARSLIVDLMEGNNNEEYNKQS